MQRRVAAALIVLALAGIVVSTGISRNVRAQQPGPTVATVRVLIYDNGGTFMAGDQATGQWAFTPNHIGVTQGQSVEFVNPQGNARPHTITSITWSGQPPMRVLTHGAAFDSSPTREELITPGNTWTLDTSSLEPGQYLYYCWLHPWMVGTITVSAAQ